MAASRRLAIIVFAPFLGGGSVVAAMAATRRGRGNLRDGIRGGDGVGVVFLRGSAGVLFVVDFVLVAKGVADHRSVVRVATKETAYHGADL